MLGRIVQREEIAFSSLMGDGIRFVMRYVGPRRRARGRTIGTKKDDEEGDDNGDGGGGKGEESTAIETNILVYDCLA